MNSSITVEQLLQANFEDLGEIRFLVMLLAGAVLLLLVGLFTERKWLLVATYLAALLISASQISLEPAVAFQGQLHLDPFKAMVQGVSLIVASLLVIFPDFWKRPFEYYFLLVALLVGSLLMTMAHHLLIIYLAVELTSLASYLLVSFRFDKKGLEGAWKYLITGLVSSALMIYGISILYGSHQTFLLDGMTLGSTPELMAGFLLIVGLLFKVSVFPLHIWVPSTYQSAPTELVALLSIVPKVCGFLLLGEVVQSFENELVYDLMIGAALITLLISSLMALSQVETKRLVAYGALAHSGFLLPLVAVPTTASETTFFYYVVIYAIMSLAIFHFIAIHEKNGQLPLEDLNGFGRDHGLLGACGVVMIIALVGLPPTAGFSIKLALFSEIWAAYNQGQNPVLLAYFVIGILSTALALFYYLRVPYHYFFRVGQATNGATPVHIGRLQLLISTFLALALLWFFIEPQIFNNFVVTISKR